MCRIPEDNFSNSRHAASNDSMIHVLEKISMELVADYQSTRGNQKTDESNENPQSRTMTWPRFEPDLSRKQAQSATAA
jgi:hypothetical protein